MCDTGTGAAEHKRELLKLEQTCKEADLVWGGAVREEKRKEETCYIRDDRQKQPRRMAGKRDLFPSRKAPI